MLFLRYWGNRVAYCSKEDTADCNDTNILYNNKFPHVFINVNFSLFWIATITLDYVLSKYAWRTHTK